jgi:2-keto-4-pentenoate hydratase/2-oxohepta-3-ene-1,7-dioic acid hydratase in catechol pathway
VRLVSWPGGFGRLEDDEVVPMGDDLVRFLSTGVAADRPALPAGRSALLAPVPRPGKIICVGLNYRDHARESR